LTDGQADLPRFDTFYVIYAVIAKEHTHRKHSELCFEKSNAFMSCVIDGVVSEHGRSCSESIWRVVT